MVETKMTSVLTPYMDDHDYRTQPGVLLGDWVADCRSNSQSARAIIAELGNWHRVELKQITDDTGDCLVWVDGPCRGHWLTWEEIDDLQAMIEQQ